MNRNQNLMSRNQIEEKEEQRFKEIVDKYKLNFIASYTKMVLKEGERLTRDEEPKKKNIIKLQAMYNIIDIINLDEKMIENHNYKYKMFDSRANKNPFLTSKEELKKQYMDSWKNSTVEVLAKKIQLENRIAKLCEYGRKRVITASMGKRSLEYFNIGLTKEEQIEEIGEIYTNNIYKKLLDKNMVDNFSKVCFNQYTRGGKQPSKALPEEEFKKIPSIKECQGLIGLYKRKYDIDILKVYEYIIFERAKRQLMSEKNKDIMELVNIYAKEKENGIPSFEISIENDKAQNKKYENVLSINIPNYVCPFKVHVKTELLRDLQKQNLFRINKQTRETGLIPSVPHKIKDEDILNVQELMKDEEKNFYKVKPDFKIKREKVMNYLIEKADKKQEYQKQEIKKNIIEINKKEEELKNEKEKLKNQKQKTTILSKEIGNLKEKHEKNLGVEPGGREWKIQMRKV